MFGGTGVLAYQSVGFASAPDTVFATAGSSAGDRQDLGLPWCVHPQLGSLLEHRDLRCLRSGVSYGNARPRPRICGVGGAVRVGAGQAGVTGCNPDFNIGQVGLITRWTPVKNLTFSADFAWTHLDQKYSGTVTPAAPLAASRPSRLRSTS